MSNLAGLIVVLKALNDVGEKLVAVLESKTAESYAQALIPAAVALRSPEVAALSEEALAAVKAAVKAIVAAVYPLASEEVAAAQTIEEHLAAIMQFAPVDVPVVPVPEPVPAPEPAPEVQPEPAPVV